MEMVEYPLQCLFYQRRIIEYVKVDRSVIERFDSVMVLLALKEYNNIWNSTNTGLGERSYSIKIKEYAISMKTLPHGQDLIVGRVFTYKECRVLENIRTISDMLDFIEEIA